MPLSRVAANTWPDRGSTARKVARPPAGAIGCQVAGVAARRAAAGARAKRINRTKRVDFRPVIPPSLRSQGAAVCDYVIKIGGRKGSQNADVSANPQRLPWRLR